MPTYEQMAIWKEQRKATKAFKDSTEGQHMARIGMAFFKWMTTKGIAQRQRERQATWQPLSKKYLKWKAKKGKSTEIWRSKGDTMDSVTNNPVTKLGLNGKLKYGVNWRAARAFIFADTLRVKGVKGKARRAAYVRMNWGHRVKVKVTQKSRLGKEYSYFRKEEGRPLFEFKQSDMPHIVKDVEVEMEKILDEVVGNT